MIEVKHRTKGVAMLRVIEVDQWTSTATQWRDKSVRFADMVGASLTGGDADAVRAIGIDRLAVRWVQSGDRPPIGRAWFCEGTDGFPELHAANYDSSD